MEKQHLMKSVTIASNAVAARLIGADKETRLEVSRLLSYEIENNGIVERRSFFRFRNDQFPAGFVNRVYTALSRMGLNVRIAKKPLPQPLGPDRPKVDDFGYIEKYDYQPDAVDALLKHGQMIAQVATGGGKSRIARIAYSRIRRNTLFLTTRGVLMHQMKDNFQTNLKEKVGVLGDSEWSPVSGFNVGMVQTLAARIQEKTISGEVERILVARALKEAKELDALRNRLMKRKVENSSIINAMDELRRQHKLQRPTDKKIAREVEAKVEKHNAERLKVLELLKRFEFVILEEAHESSGNNYFDIMNKCVNANYRLALTATPFMREEEEANMRLMACSGPIGIRVTERTLIDRGILAQPIFRYIPTKPPTNLYKSTKWQRAYKVGIVENEYRNKYITLEVAKAVRAGLPVMVLVLRKDHGSALLKMFRDQGIRSEFIFGEHEQEMRQRSLSKLKSGAIQCLIGSTILDVGVDVPSVGMVVLAGGGKAETALRQRIGRGLRAKSSGPNQVFVVDFIDNGNKYLTDHSIQRKAIVESTDGFHQGILPIGVDFDYSIFESAA